MTFSFSNLNEKDEKIFLLEMFGTIKSLYTGAISTIVSYNASAVKIYSATSSLVRFVTKKFNFEKTLWVAYCKFRSLRIESRSFQVATRVARFF
jgi:hypothetical protein